MGTVGSNSSRNSEIFGNTLNSDNTDCMRTLVVVDIRGSSTNRGWLTDFVGTHVSNNISYNENGGNDNGSLGSTESPRKYESTGFSNDDFQSDLRTDVSMGNVGSDYNGNSEIFWNTLSSDNSDCMRTLVVVDIRGTSTNRGWLTDFVGTHVSNNISYNENGGNKMELWEFLKDLANMNPLEVLAMILNPVYGPMFWWLMLGLITTEIQKFLGIR